MQEVKSERKPEEVPEKVLSLVDRALRGNDTADNEGIWPFVWDFAGQAVYHAIHPSSYIKNINSVTNVSIAIALNNQSLIILRLTGILLYVVCT